jgi:hypothetical protein
MEMLGNMSEGQGIDSDKDQDALQQFVSKLFQNLDAKQYVIYAKLICEGSHVNGQPINFNSHFTGKMSELHKVMFQILRHQYGDFLDGSAAAE